MVSTSKILTVSYGTFSCTLEGFDDSFDTMKAIAEYFRDLSAGDRYFGAEPATPDAEMLARIAEREISRHVEARDTDGTIHLRAGPAALTAIASQDESTPSQSQTSSDRPAPESDPAVSTDPVDMSQARPPAGASAAPSACAATEDCSDNPAVRSTTSAPNVQSIADKLRRIRAVADAAGSTSSDSGSDEDEQAQDFPADPASDPAADQPQEGVFAADDDAVGGAENAQTDVQDDEPAPTAVQAEATQPPETEPEEDPTADVSADAAVTPAEEVAEVEAVAEAPITGQPDGDVVPATTPDTAVASLLSDDDILSRLSAQDPRANTTREAGPDDDDTSAASAEIADDSYASAYDELDELLWSAVGDADALAPSDHSDRNDRDDNLALLLADTLQDGATTQEEEAAAVEISGDQADDGQTILPELASCGTDSDADRVEMAEPRNLRARVVKIKRADLKAVLAGENHKEAMFGSESHGSLSPESEADLLDQLAELEADLHQSRAPQTQVPHPADAPTPVAADADATEPAIDSAAASRDEGNIEAFDEFPQHMFATLKDAGDAHRDRPHDQTAPDAQASRIFDEADMQLGEPESNKRRSAIQHLRGAVAATKAEHRAGGAMSPGVDDQPYRKDLQSAVRPRRPQAVTAATPRPDALPSGRSAPLKLVAEQRIDMPAIPVRPRRIIRADVAAAPTTPTAGQQKASIGFADYAERMGANSLTDLMEAAAAYMADVEGTPQFSRPMLMQKLREAHEDDFSREEGLRSFGQLMRQGKLQKLTGGRFAVTDVTDFRQSA